MDSVQKLQKAAKTASCATISPSVGTRNL
jgi:hypothetical protein